MVISDDDYKMVMALLFEMGVYIHTEKPTEPERKDALEVYFKAYDIMNENVHE